VNFDQCFQALLSPKREGGYVDNRDDPGGETRYGICKRDYPAEDIKNLTIERAATIYLRDFWGPCGADALPDGMRLQVFDMAVNSGVPRAVQTLQKAAGVTADGALGPVTLQAVNSMPVPRLIARFNAYRLFFLADLNNWPNAGRGWARRIAINLLEA
jgi:lysozyme family protein